MIARTLFRLSEACKMPVTAPAARLLARHRRKAAALTALACVAPRPALAGIAGGSATAPAMHVPRRGTPAGAPGQDDRGHRRPVPGAATAELPPAVVPRVHLAERRRLHYQSKIGRALVRGGRCVC